MLFNMKEQLKLIKCLFVSSRFRMFLFGQVLEWQTVAYILISISIPHAFKNRHTCTMRERTCQENIPGAIFFVCVHCSVRIPTFVPTTPSLGCHNMQYWVVCSHKQVFFSQVLFRSSSLSYLETDCAQDHRAIDKLSLVLSGKNCKKQQPYCIGICFWIAVW